MHARASWYTALFRVSLLGVRFRCVSLAQKIWMLQNGKQHGFPCFLYLYFILFLALSYMYDLEVGHEKSIFTRTETFSITICFKEPLLYYTQYNLHRKDFSSSAITQCRQLISHDNAHAAELTSRMRVKSLSTRAPSSRVTCQLIDFNETLPF